VLEVIVPHEQSLWASADPTHKYRFNERSFLYFSDSEEFRAIQGAYGISTRFHIRELVKHGSRNGRALYALMFKGAPTEAPASAKLRMGPSASNQVGCP
jgi:hypothetical protein